MVKDLMFPGLDEFNYNPMNDAIFKFILGKRRGNKLPLIFLMLCWKRVWDILSRI